MPCLLKHRATVDGALNPDVLGFLVSFPGTIFAEPVFIKVVSRAEEQVTAVAGAQITGIKRLSVEQDQIVRAILNQIAQSLVEMLTSDSGQGRQVQGDAGFKDAVGEGFGVAWRKGQRQVTFDRRELFEILKIYGRMVASGEWRGYAIDHLADRAVFSVFRRTAEAPLFRIEKNPKLAARQGAYSVIDQGGRILKRGPDLARVVAVLEKKPKLVES